MFGRLTRNRRARVLLLAWLLFDGLSWADTFDFSDDIFWPAAIGQAVKAETSETKTGISLLVSICLLASMVTLGTIPLLSKAGNSPFLFLATWLPAFGIPLYQRFSTYRI